MLDIIDTRFKLIFKKVKRNDFMNDKLVIKGAKEHNLKNVNIEIPKNKLVQISVSFPSS